MKLHRRVYVGKRVLCIARDGTRFEGKYLETSRTHIILDVGRIATKDLRSMTILRVMNKER